MTFATRLPSQRAYAVVWDDGTDVSAGRLEFLPDRLEFHSRAATVAIPFVELRTASIAREHGHRLRGLPVLTLRLIAGTVIRIATLEGAGVLQELAANVRVAGLEVVA